LQEALAEGEGAEEAPPLVGEEKADVCIVGGGYTGLWTALALKEQEPALDVTIVERDIGGGGPSGRNGGFVMTWWSKFTTLQKICGTEEAVRLARLAQQAVVDIGEFCDENGIDAHYRRDGWLWMATSPAQIDAWEETFAAVSAAGQTPYERVSPEFVAERSGSPMHLAGIWEAGAASVQPAYLARGLRRVALERGVQIHEQTPMTRLVRGRPPRVETERGSVTAEKVILAMNAWVGSLPEYRRSLVTITSDIVATPPAPERLDAIGWRDGISLSDSRRLVNYYRRTIDGRVIFGKGGGTLAFAGRIPASFDRESRRWREVTNHLHRLYPMLWDLEPTISWRGPIDYSLTGAPFFTKLGGRPDLLVGAGYSGNGVGPSYVGGRILASLALERDDQWSAAGLVGDPRGALPPEPLRFAGGLVVRESHARKERAEDAGRRPSWLATKLSKLDPTSFIDRGLTKNGAAALRSWRSKSNVGDE
jgi:putative aminophosphonate oxidoreductase